MPFPTLQLYGSFDVGFPQKITTRARLLALPT